MWFHLPENTLQDDKSLPILFNCFFAGYGGFECYLNQRRLFYRILPKTSAPGLDYKPPSKPSHS